MSANAPLFLGLDVGTQGVRAALYNLQGMCVGSGSAPLDTFHPHPGWAEQHAEQWWYAACAAVPQALARAGVAPESVVAIGLACTACTVLASGLDGTPLRPALLWMDQRSFHEAEEISATRDPSLRYVSGVVSPEWMLPKALWLKRHQPAIYDRAARIVECTDWFMFRLTGKWALSLNNVTVKWDYARPDNGWSLALLRAVGLEDLPGKWPSEIVPLGKGDGKLSAAAATDLGLKANIPVAQGGIDAYLGMLGMGAVGAGDLAMILGSSTCHLAMSSVGLFGSGMLGCYPDAVVEGLYTLEGGQTATGSIMKWYAQHFAGEQVRSAELTGVSVFEVLDAQAAEVPPGSEGLVCLDYWQGNRCPHKDPRARGVLWGFTLAHTAGHVYRSICEGTAFGTRAILEDLEQHRFQVQRLFAGGGGAKSLFWLQIHADVLGRPISLPRESEACSLGSALVAAVHAGHFGSLQEAARAMVQIARVLEPAHTNRAVYDEMYNRYRNTYTAMRSLMHATHG